MASERRRGNARAALTPEQLVEHLRRRLPEFTPTAAPERIRVSYRNDVYRVPGEPEPVIVKVANAQVPLDERRLAMEARSLAALQPGGALEQVSRPAARPPRPLDVDEAQQILVLEDVGEASQLGDWLAEGSVDGELFAGWNPGQRLGRFIADLHWESFADPQLAVEFDNSAIHGAWLRRHYGAVADLSREAGLSDADELGQRAIALGEQFESPGVCVIHGQLWPPSILIRTDGRLRIVDWELAHYGHPARDVGHLAAHLWMQAHWAATPDAADRARDTLEDVLVTYRSELGFRFDDVFGLRGVRRSTIHIGTEILRWTVAAAREGYRYGGRGQRHPLALEDPAVQEAIEAAARHIRSPEQADTLAPLLP